VAPPAAESERDRPFPGDARPATGRRPSLDRVVGLPTTMTPLVDRDNEVAAALALLRREDIRLVTIVGPGGVGKTRLAIRVAAEAVALFGDGGWWVDLAPLRDPALVVPTVALAVGIRDVADPNPLELLARELGDRRVLLALDNVEQLLEAAPLLAGLLARCPGLKLLATSRSPLRLSAEHELPVAPLTLPDPAQPPTPARLMESAAVRLFLDRARLMRPGFELTTANAADVAAICARVDGLPLAIELAAGWLRLLPPAALLTRLQQRLPLLTGGARDLPARQQTMRDAIAWSYDLLAPEERTLFRHLAVFVGGFSLEAAESVGRRLVDEGSRSGRQRPSDLRPPTSVLDLLGRLIEKNLIAAGDAAGDEPRYRLYETVREFAWEQLAATSEVESAVAAHAAFFRALAERAESGLRGPDQAAWLRRLEADHDNLRAVVRRSLEASPPDNETALRVGIALWPFWERRGYPREGQDWLDEAVDDAAAPPRLRAEALRLLGNLALDLGDYRRAGERYRASEALWRALGDEAGVATSLNGQGLVAFDQGDFDRARSLHEESLAIRSRLGDEAATATSLYNLARVAEATGAAAEAVRLHRRALDIRQRSGDERTAAYSAWRLARLDLGGGQPVALESRLEQLRREFERFGDRFGVAFLLHDLGLVAASRLDYRRAAALFDESLALRHELGERQGAIESLEELGRLAPAVGAPTAGAKLLAAAAALRERLGTPLPPAARAALGKETAALRKTLGDAAFDGAWAFGRELTLAQAVAAAGDVVVAATAADAPPPAPPPPRAGTPDPGLTARELEVLGLIAEGRTSREIADLLFLSHRTVSSHLTNIYGKIGVSTRSAAAAYAVRHRLV